MIPIIPKGVEVFADEFGSLWPCVASTEKIERERLAYADQKVFVPYDAWLLVAHDRSRQHVAERFAQVLRDAGYQDVNVKVGSVRPVHELGEVGA